MANVAVINAVGITSHAFKSLSGGPDALSRVLVYSRRLPDVERIFLFTDSERAAKQVAEQTSSEGGTEVSVRDGSWSIRRLFDEFQEISKGATDLFYFYGDCPLLDAPITRRMYENHRKYYAEYSFADGYPRGMTPEILQVERIPAMARLISKSDGAIERDTIFTILQRDINAFDIETEIAPKDLRLLRVQLSCDTARNSLITGRIVAAGGVDEDSILEIVETKQGLLRSLPAYFEVQITEAVSQLVSYSPYPKIAGDVLKKGREMDPGAFAALADRIAEFSEDAVISLSLWGEPALHSRIVDLAEAVLRHESLELLIETSAVGWSLDALKAIRELPWQRITWIVDLDASTKELYESLRGPGWEEAQDTCAALIEYFPGRVHVQAVRMQENEADLEGFYRYWKDRVSNVIIQKYDWFCGYLPQRKVTDLSPLRRLPCWHLKRDMVILLDGRVPMCREDLENKHILGNVFSQPIEEIWAKSEGPYLRHLTGDYPEICKGCDEYYTYNF